MAAGGRSDALGRAYGAAMKFLLDANMPYSAKELFPKPDEVLHVRDIGLAGASDAAIIADAVRESAVIITRDLDFGNIILHPIASHKGAVILRAPSSFTASQINELLKGFLSTVDKNNLADAITILELHRYRVRRK